MRALDWTTLFSALIALVGTIFTGVRSRQQSKKPNPVEQAAIVSDIATKAAERMGVHVESLEKEIKELRQTNDKHEDVIQEMRETNTKLTRRINALEDEVLRLGGDPTLVLTG